MIKLYFRPEGLYIVSYFGKTRSILIPEPMIFGILLVIVLIIGLVIVSNP